MNVKFLAVSLVMSLALGGCGTNADEAPKLPTVKSPPAQVAVYDNADNTKFTPLPLQPPQGLIPLAASPDGKTLFCMERIPDRKLPAVIKGAYTIKGSAGTRVNIYSLDRDSGKMTPVQKDIPFVNLAKWNPQGISIAFCGGQNLTAYDMAGNRQLINDDVPNNPVTYFGWSPDGKTLYTEHPNLINCSIINTDPQKITMTYETSENLFYKGIFDDNSFYATKTTSSGDSMNTLIVDDKRKVLKDLPGGRFRDSYGKSMLQAGPKGYELYVIADTDKVTEMRPLTYEYIYDAKFVAGGNFFYTVKHPDPDKNLFMLYVSDRGGSSLASVPVSGPCIALSPDGKTGYCSGPGSEVIDFGRLVSDFENEKIRYEQTVNSLDTASAQQEEIFQAIRGAMDIYYKYEMTAEKDLGSIDKFFTDTVNPVQCAAFDIKRFLDDGFYQRGAGFYEMHLYVDKIDAKGDRASARVQGGCSNSHGSGMGIGQALELAKVEGRWYVTGLSTFPGSKQYSEVLDQARKYVSDSQQGKLFDGLLKGKDVEIGQLQFWQMSDPHLATDVNHSNYCKIYLKVRENGGESIYKMVLTREDSPYWKPVKLSNERLSYLF